MTANRQPGQTALFNSNTYEVEVEVPSGVHPLKIYAHNPVGWSNWNEPAIVLELVISSASIGSKSLALILFVSTLGLVNAF